MTKIVIEDKAIQGADTRNTLPKEFAFEVLSGITTPDVINRTLIILNNSGATSITDFLNGQFGQTIRVLALDANTTINNNSTVKTNTGANKLLVANKIYTFTYYNNVWYESE